MHLDVNNLLHTLVHNLLEAVQGIQSDSASFMLDCENALA